MVSCSGFGLPLHAQLLRLFVTRHSSWACIGNPNPEQEAIKGTHSDGVVVPAPAFLCFAPLSIVTACYKETQ